MEVMKYWKVIVFMVIAGIVGWGLLSLYQSRNAADKQAAALKAQYDKLQEQNQNLSSEVQYFQNPANLVKQLKAQTNYKNPGEGLIIVVPGSTTTTSTATGTQQ